MTRDEQGPRAPRARSLVDCASDRAPSYCRPSLHWDALRRRSRERGYAEQSMELLDTRTRRRVMVAPGRTVRIYVCGITPYEASHLGHAFVYSVFDALIRYLEHLGHRVRYVRNITDVDDDILRKARELNVDYRELARREVEWFDRDLARLGLRRPDAEPRATAMIPAIVQAIRGLIATRCAYALTDGRVYFDTGKAKGFGALSRLDRDEMLRQFAEKGGDPEAPGKRDALDFLLWQPSAKDEPSWPSDWGPGRPGWHIECSVMAMEELGAVIDVHGGGSDLIFPHHEAEILQSEHLTGQGPFARIWAHAGMVSLNGEKMSKSLGNLVHISDLLERFESDAIRRYLLSHHYRQTWEHQESSLQTAALAVEHWRKAVSSEGVRSDLEAVFAQAMADDLDIPRAIKVLDEAAQEGAGQTLQHLANLLGFHLNR
jgi:L-cysteine:1D-myo-inositol 2-amino-2-deoxy-alpha-D-glucopyranoside ligase